MSARCFVCVKLRFGCSPCDDTHIAAFDTARGSKELEREKGKGEAQGKERWQEWQKIQGGEMILCLFLFMHVWCVYVWEPCVSAFLYDNVCYMSLQICVSLMYPVCVQYACVHLHVSYTGHSFFCRHMGTQIYIYVPAFCCVNTCLYLRQFLSPMCMHFPANQF